MNEVLMIFNVGIFFCAGRRCFDYDWSLMIRSPKYMPESNQVIYNKINDILDMRQFISDTAVFGFDTYKLLPPAPKGEPTECDE
jgi:hypothetical protein